ncbi:hypothetical protein B0H19DRAFT_1263677 [Mycena capillaripes]|nr:hypothetical protein B0H19DRAFT_1263677 [Mycena capillaripes]
MADGIQFVGVASSVEPKQSNVFIHVHGSCQVFLPRIAFRPPPDMEIISRVVLGLVITGVSLTAALLILFGYAALNPASRRHLDRVSFRLLVYALVAHLVYGIVFLIGTISACPGWMCDLLAFFDKLSLMFSAGMFFCIALNLPLVLAYKVNGQKMEKFYIFGTVLVCLVCNIVPYATGNFGHVSLIYLQSYAPDLASRQVVHCQRLGVVLTFWFLLASVGEVCAFLIIVGYLIAYTLDTRYFHTDSRLNATSASGDSLAPAFTVQMFRKIILRIGLYPLVSCLLNISTSVLDFYMMMYPEAELSLRLGVSDLVIYSARPLIYGLLAATDPSFLRALQALWYRESAAQSETQARHAYRSGQCLSTVIEMPEEEGIEFAAGFAKGDVRENPTSAVTGLKDGKEQPINEGHPPNPRIGMPIITLSIQRASIDFVCHI